MEAAMLFQHTAARRRLGADSRRLLRLFRGFNTQPPEGGWVLFAENYFFSSGFNTQPPEGGWV